MPVANRRMVHVIGRCGICSFEPEKGEQVVAVDDDGTRLAVYPFEPLGTYHDTETGVQYRNTFSEQWIISNWVVACHVDCLASEPDKLARERFHAMAYNYHPRPAELERRERWLRSTFAPVLHGILRRFSLPLEVCELITTFCCLRAWAAATSRTFWEERSAANSTPVPYHRFNLEKQVWARLVELEGVRYIACPTNEPGEVGEQRDALSLIYSPTPGQVVDTLFVAEDYLGIRGVYFASSAALPDLQDKQSPGAWWKRFKLTPGTSFDYLDVGTDGTKSRGLYLTFKPNRADVRWNATNSDFKSAFEQPLTIDRLWWHSIFGTDYGMQMTSFVCNNPATTAYSVCCDDRPYTIHAHADGEQDLTFYAAESRPERHAAVWLHMPIDPDEKVTEVWVRHWWTHAHIYDAAFVLRTNQDRTLVMGSYATRQPRVVDDMYDYKLVYQAGKDPGRIYFDISLKGIHELALEYPLPPHPDPGQPPLPQPESECPGDADDENYFYTSADLDGVAEITACRTDLGIIGLLLHYHDGRRASLGQVRLDRLQQPPIRIDPARPMWLRFSVSEDGCPNIGAITFDPPAQAGPEDFIASWHGTLEWWFSHRQCRLWQDGRSSPSTAKGRTLQDEVIVLLAGYRY